MRQDDGGERGNDRIYNSILDIHKKIDGLKDDISAIKIAAAPIPFRIKILEAVVYGGIGLIILSVAGDTLSKDKASAQTVKTYKVAQEKTP